MIDLDVIKEKVHLAEVHSYGETGSFLGWPKKYGEGLDLEEFAKDFKGMIKEIEQMRGTIFNLECLIETLGGSVDNLI